MSDQPKSKKHPHAIAWENYEASEEGRKSLDASTLGTTSPDTYLRNRIKSAYLAGCDFGNPPALSSGETLMVRAAKEYPWGVFTLWVFPGDALKYLPDGKLLLMIQPRDDIAREAGQRSRRELYWSTYFHVVIPAEDLIRATPHPESHP